MSLNDNEEDAPELKAFNARMKRLEADVMNSVGAELSRHGFSKDKGMFIRWHGKMRCDRFTLVFKDAVLGNELAKSIEPHVGVRFERVEDIFHQTSGFEPKYQKRTPTIGTSIGLMLAGDTRAHQSIITSEVDIPRVTTEIVELFQKYALPYFDKFGSLHAIDAELNNRPTRDTVHRVVPWLRCSTGVIVAKLVRRPDYPRLTKIYTDVMRKQDRGFYLRNFEALLKSLEVIGPESE